MSNKDKKAAKAAVKVNLAEKKAAAPIVANEETKKTQPIASKAPVEAPTPPPVEAPVETLVEALVEAPASTKEAPIIPEIKKEEASAKTVPAPKVEKPVEVKKAEAKASDKPTTKKEELKKPVIKTPAIPTKKAEEIERSEEDTTEAISPMYNRLHDASGKSRFSHADALKLGTMFKEEFNDDPDLNASQKQFIKTQYRGMLFTEMLFYNAQVAADFQTLGVLVNPKQFIAIEAQAREQFGITLKGLPFEGNDQQLLIKFEEDTVSKQVQKEVVEAVKARTEVPEIPEPDIAMEDTEKMKVLSAIAAQKNGHGNNLCNMIDWAGKAFGLTDANSGQILTFIFDKYKGQDPLLLSSITNALNGKFFTEHSILSPHALLKSWTPKLEDKVVADLIKVFISRATEKRTIEWNLRCGDALKSNIDNEFVIISRKIKVSITPEVTAGILEKNTEISVNDPEDKLGVLINGDKCFKTLIGAYGDSKSIIKDKITEIVGYYSKPIGRLSTYIDKSAYAE